MIIALKGPAQCGKSTLASMLEKELTSRGFNVKRTAFGDFVREEIATELFARRKYDRCNDPDCFRCGEGMVQVPAALNQALNNFNATIPIKADWDKELIIRALEFRPAKPESRIVQQIWGQDFRRAQDPLYWVKKSFLANAEFILESGNNILIEESCRQLNEGHYVHALVGIVLDLKPLPSPTESENAAMAHSVEQAAMSWKGDTLVDMHYVFNLSEVQREIWISRTVEECLERMGLTTWAMPLPPKR